MATLEVEINDLKVKIAGYEQEYASATSEERKDRLLAVITAKETRLNALLQQQQQQQLQQGKVIIPLLAPVNSTSLL